MEINDILKKLYKILNIISFIIIIIAYGFVIAQSIINIIYSSNNSKEIIVERIVYEQFSHEVYSNINSKIITNISIENDCGNKETYSLPIKIESFYDCRDVYNYNIDKELCQNKITSSSLCCNEECCTTLVTGKKEYRRCKDNKKNNDDKRNYYCSKYSKYNGKVYELVYYNNQKNICVQRLDMTYEDLLRNADNDGYSYSTNIKIDSKKHYYHSNIHNYNNEVMVKMIGSVTKLSYFEMESNIELSKMLNKINYNVDKIKKKIQTLSEISAKNIFDTFTDKECSGDNCYDNNYFILDYYSPNSDDYNYQFYYYMSLNNIIRENSDTLLMSESSKNNEYIKSQDISLYSRSYIGFANTTELYRFKKHFDSNNHKNNALYKISTTLFPNYGSCILGGIICIILIIIICVCIKKFTTTETDFLFFDYNINIFKLFLILFLFLLYLLLYLIGYYFRFEEINIDMENFYQKVLEKYNYRRKQLFLVIGVIIFGFNLFLELIIQNIKFSFTSNVDNGVNGPAVNTIQVIFQFKNINCNHKRKLYKKKSFISQFEKIEKGILKCRKCNAQRQNEEIKGFTLGNKDIDVNEIVNKIGIKNNDVIIIETSEEE